MYARNRTVLTLAAIIMLAAGKIGYSGHGQLNHHWGPLLPLPLKLHYKSYSLDNKENDVPEIDPEVRSVLTELGTDQHE